MTNPRNDQTPPTEPVDDASEPLKTAYGDEGADAVGAEADGPIKPLDADGGAYIVP